MQTRKILGKCLEQFVEQFWLADMRGSEARPNARENVLPVGSMHIVFRLSGSSLKVFEGDKEKIFGPAIVGGASR